MIPRYSRTEMAAIWELANKYKIWLEIEAHACDKQAELGVIPAEAAKVVREKGSFDIDRIDEIERETRHDVIALAAGGGYSPEGYQAAFWMMIGLQGLGLTWYMIFRKPSI